MRNADGLPSKLHLTVERAHSRFTYFVKKLTG
jgi:hypothetical protein